MRKDEFPLIDAYADSKVNDVLDKITAEIESIEITYDSSLSDDKRTDAEKCKDWHKLYNLIILQVIDKYKKRGTNQP